VKAPPIVATRKNNFKRQKSPRLEESRWEKKSKEYVLLRRDEVEELRGMEKLLKQEKRHLQKQCSWIFNDTQMSARIPMPVVKMAVTDVCRAEMREAQSLLKVVLAADSKKIKTKISVPIDTVLGKSSPFDVFAKSDTRGVYVTKETVWPTFKVDWDVMNRTPVATRGDWYIRQKVRAEAELQEFERNTMMMEETVQRLSWRYLEARNRLADYCTYYDYAVRYGPFDEADFQSHATPGKTYHDRCTFGARQFQRMWWAKWPPKRMWMDICSTRMGSLWRGIWVRKRWRPIVKMRMHHGRYAKMLRCLNPWKSWVAKMKRAKKLLEGILIGDQRAHYTAWKELVQQIKKEREEIAKKALNRFIHRREFAVFNAWYSFVEKKKRIMTMMRRAIGNPAFGTWLEYTYFIKEQKMVLRGMTAIQSMYRGWIARVEYAGILKFMGVMRRLVRTKKSLNFVGVALSALVDENYRKKMDDYLKDAVTDEERRLQEFSEHFDKIESGIRKVKTVQLKTRKGKREVKELSKEIMEEYNNNKEGSNNDKITSKDAEEMAKARLLNIACDEARLQMRHDFESKNPPKYQSADFANPQTFVFEEHYLQACPIWAPIDLCVKSEKGSELFEYFIDRTYGVGKEKFTINFLQHVQKWKKTNSKSEDFRDVAVDIYNNHLDSSATQVAAIGEKLREKLGVELMKIEIQEDQKDELEEKRKKGIFGKLATLGQKVKETTLRANIFDEACFEGLMFLKEKSWENFCNSNLGEEYHVHVKKLKDKRRERMVGEYLAERRQKALAEAGDIKKQLKSMAAVAEEHKRLTLLGGEAFFELEIENMITEAIDQHAKEEEAKELAKEMANIAAINNMSNLFMKNLESNLSDELIDIAVDEIVDAKIKNMIDRKAEEVLKNVFEPFIETLCEEHCVREVNCWIKDGMHLSKSERAEVFAAIKVQTRVRGVMTRRNVRRLVSVRFVKQFDDYNNAHYWLDNDTGNTTWDKPEVFRILWRGVDRTIALRIPPPSGPPKLEYEGGMGIDTSLIPFNGESLDGSDEFWGEEGSYEESYDGGGDGGGGVHYDESIE